MQRHEVADSSLDRNFKDLITSFNHIRQAKQAAAVQIVRERLVFRGTFGGTEVLTILPAKSFDSPRASRTTNSSRPARSSRLLFSSLPKMGTATVQRRQGYSSKKDLSSSLLKLSTTTSSASPATRPTSGPRGTPPANLPFGKGTSSAAPIFPSSRNPVIPNPKFVPRKFEHEELPFEHDDGVPMAHLPETQNVLSEFYNEIQVAFKKFKTTPPYPNAGTLRLTFRNFRVCWTISDLYERNHAKYGNVEIFDEDAPLELVECNKDLVRAVRIGVIDIFPLDGVSLFYCPENDMVYYYSAESLDDDFEEGRDVRAPLRVFPFGRLKNLMAETKASDMKVP